MKYLPIDNNLFIRNRKAFAKRLKPNSLAVFNSNDIMPSSADGIRSFIQNTDLFYMSGIDQEETILVICPNAHEKKNREILFVRETNEKIATWEGRKLTKEKAARVSGIKTVHWTSTFENILHPLAVNADNIYLNTNEHLRADTTVETRDMRFLKWCKNRYPLHKYERLAPVMNRLRAVKSPIEIDLISRACHMTEQAFRRILGFVGPGKWEFEIEAEMCHEFLRNRSRGPAFEPIVASGPNSCILHYVRNNRQCEDGDILLLDFGAEYANYASDVTRTIPVNGKFTERQKAVYNAVLRIQKAAIRAIVPGKTIEQCRKEAVKTVEAELKKLKLIRAKDIKKQDRDKPLYKEYFMHGISHHLGLDVHDYGDVNRKLEPGMVLTCEPGIYIRKENLGIRIENDILVTSDGPVDLTENIPVEADEIEALMAAHGK